jgi:hypothetical protein
VRIYDYGADIQLMLADVRARNYPSPIHLRVLPGPAPDGSDGLFIVATWTIGDEIYLAWEPAPSEMPGQHKLRELWAGYALFAGFRTRGGVADARCWPPPVDRPGWTVEVRMTTSEPTPLGGPEVRVA